MVDIGKTDKDICDGVEDAVCDYQRSDWATVKVGVVKAGNGMEEAHSACRGMGVLVEM